MANTYTQLYIQFVFAVQDRMSLIRPEWEEELYRYVTGIVQNKSHKMIAVNGVADHLHLFVGLHTTQSIADFMRMVKGESSEWINAQRYVTGRFSWQEGYGAFSYGRSQINQVYEYIANQKKHHARINFEQEYIQLLEKFELKFDKQYIFKPIH